MAVLEVRNLKKKFGNTTVLKDVSFICVTAEKLSCIFCYDYQNNENCNCDKNQIILCGYVLCGKVVGKGFEKFGRHKYIYQKNGQEF